MLVVRNAETTRIKFLLVRMRSEDFTDRRQGSSQKSKLSNGSECEISPFKLTGTKPHRPHTNHTHYMVTNSLVERCKMASHSLSTRHYIYYIHCILRSLGATLDMLLLMIKA